MSNHLFGFTVNFQMYKRKEVNLEYLIAVWNHHYLYLGFHLSEMSIDVISYSINLALEFLKTRAPAPTVCLFTLFPC